MEAALLFGRGSSAVSSQGSAPEKSDGRERRGLARSDAWFQVKRARGSPQRLEQRSFPPPSTLTQAFDLDAGFVDATSPQRSLDEVWQANPR